MLPCRSDMRGAGMEFRAGAFRLLGLFPLTRTFAFLGFIRPSGGTFVFWAGSCSISPKIVTGRVAPRRRLCRPAGSLPVVAPADPVMAGSPMVGKAMICTSKSAALLGPFHL